VREPVGESANVTHIIAAHHASEVKKGVRIVSSFEKLESQARITSV
jgi:hypothetical protein